MTRTSTTYRQHVLGTDFLAESKIMNNVLEDCGTTGQGDNAGANGIGVGTDGFMTQYGTSSEPTVISGNNVFGTANKGIMVEGQTGGSGAVGYIISNNNAYGGRVGFGIAGTVDTVLTNNNAYGNSNFGIELHASSFSGSTTANTIIEGNNVFNNGTTGIYSPTLRRPLLSSRATLSRAMAQMVFKLEAIKRLSPTTTSQITDQTASCSSLLHPETRSTTLP